MYWNGKVCSLCGWTLPKIPMILKIALKKSYKIEFPAKNSVVACLYLSQEWSLGRQTSAIFEKMFKPDASTEFS